MSYVVAEFLAENFGIVRGRRRRVTAGSTFAGKFRQIGRHCFAIFLSDYRLDGHPLGHGRFVFLFAPGIEHVPFFDRAAKFIMSQQKRPDLKTRARDRFYLNVVTYKDDKKNFFFKYLTRCVLLFLFRAEPRRNR